jgi:hypothetical protein
MTTGRKFALILLFSVALASGISHALLHRVGAQIQADVPAVQDFQPDGPDRATPMIVGGSSMIAAAFDWKTVAQECSKHIKFVYLPGGSPCELEVLEKQLPDSDFTIIGVSLGDMDDDAFSDFRAAVVPMARTWEDLWESRADEDLVQRLTREYCLRYVRLAFPTAGRSAMVLVQIRSTADHLMGRQLDPMRDIVPGFNATAGETTNRVSDWDASRRLRKIEVQREFSASRHWFGGPKRLALERMLRFATSRGKALVIVMPESPLYQEEVIDPAVKQKFDESLRDLAGRAPAVKWIRMDRLPQLRNNDLYCDLMHFNAYGRALAMPELLQRLKSILREP